MYRVKVQLDDGEVREVGVAKLIIECGGVHGSSQIHLTASGEGVIVDRIFDDEVAATCCMDAEALAERCW